MDGVSLFCLYLESGLNRFLLEERRQGLVRFSTAIDFECCPWSAFALGQLINMFRRFSADGSRMRSITTWQMGRLWCQTKALSDSPVVGKGRNAAHWEGESPSTIAACLYAASLSMLSTKTTSYCGCQRLIMDSRLSPRV